ncbi:MAG: hypothetical protein Kilf2KO_44460 [Rhodospirillales bacterium]
MKGLMVAAVLVLGALWGKPAEAYYPVERFYADFTSENKDTHRRAWNFLDGVLHTLYEVHQANAPDQFCEDPTKWAATYDIIILFIERNEVLEERPTTPTALIVREAFVPLITCRDKPVETEEH